MAITIIDEPMAFWPICNNVEWTFESDNTGQANFSFTVEVYINGGLNSTHQVFPEDGDSGKFKRAKMAVTRILYSSSSGFIRLEEAFACLPVCPIELHTNARAKASSVHARHTHTFSGLMSSVGVWSCVYLRLRAG